jgi:hypothetical protein
MRTRHDCRGVAGQGPIKDRIQSYLSWLGFCSKREPATHLSGSIIRAAPDCTSLNPGNCPQRVPPLGRAQSGQPVTPSQSSIAR